MNKKSESKVEVRSAVREDVPLILSLIRDLALYERAPEQVTATEADVERCLFGAGFGRGPVAESLIGSIDGTPQGFAVFFTNYSTWLSKPGIYLEDLFVRPASRGHGLGKALLRRIALLAVERGCGRVEWAVLDWNEPAIGFYRKLGATPMQEWTVFRLTGEGIGMVARGD